MCVINQNLGTTIFPLFGDDNTCKLFTNESKHKQELMQTTVKQNTKIEKQKRKKKNIQREYTQEIDAGTGIECTLEVCTLTSPC